jgi:hypothetical protein
MVIIWCGYLNPCETASCHRRRLKWSPQASMQLDMMLQSPHKWWCFLWDHWWCKACSRKPFPLVVTTRKPLVELKLGTCQPEVFWDNSVFNTYSPNWESCPVIYGRQGRPLSKPYVMKYSFTRTEVCTYHIYSCITQFFQNYSFLKLGCV